MKTLLVLPLATLLLTLGCCSTPEETETLGVSSMFPVADRASLAHGADIGWLSWLESKGVTWADAAGVVTDPVVLLRDLGIDAVRLRVMVNPDSATGVGFADQDSVVAMAQRCVQAGISNILIDFHLSDTWADPGHQEVPASWADDTDAELAAHVAAHVTAVLSALKAVSVTPAWVQLGNEETQGVLWDLLGKVNGTAGWDRLAPVLNAGYEAVKAVDPSIAVILHLDKGYSQSLYQWWFDNFKKAGGKWDVIGLSFYPYWQPSGTVLQLYSNLKFLAARYVKPVMVVEIGGLETDASGTKTLLENVKSAVASVPDDQGLGVFYWEPEGHSSVNGGYKLGAARSLGSKRLQFTPALEGLGRAEEKL